MKKLKLHEGLLRLNKKQITDLTPGQMGRIKGGAASQACKHTIGCTDPQHCVHQTTTVQPTNVACYPTQTCIK